MALHRQLYCQLKGLRVVATLLTSAKLHSSDASRTIIASSITIKEFNYDFASPGTTKLRPHPAWGL